MILCVLRSGGIYTQEWVRKLHDATKRQTTRSHRFVCLTDLELPFETVKLKHNWPGWWSKIEIYRPGVITEPCLYLDLDTIVVGNIDHLLDLDYDFAMLQNFHASHMVNSSVVWFKDERSVPTQVYQKFSRMPECYIEHHQRVQKGAYLGDQAFVWDALDGEIPRLSGLGIFSYKYHCRSHLPPDARIVCFHGPPRPSEVKTEWLDKHWV
mgnify:FL=1